MTTTTTTTRRRRRNDHDPSSSSSLSPDLIRNLSRHQYGSLKFIHDNHVSLDYLRNAHANTLGSLAERGYLQRDGENVVLSQAGIDALHVYTHASLNERAHEGELTDRCMRLLKHVRRGIAKTA